MNKRRLWIPCLVLLAIILGGCGVMADTAGRKPPEEKTAQHEEKTVYPKIVCADNTLYYGTDEKCEAVPRRSPDGTIETFVPEEIMPDAHNSANFGSEWGKLEYMFTEDGRLMVHIGEDWYYFESMEENNGAEKS